MFNHSSTNPSSSLRILDNSDFQFYVKPFSSFSSLRVSDFDSDRAIKLKQLQQAADIILANPEAEDKDQAIDKLMESFSNFFHPRHIPLRKQAQYIADQLTDSAKDNYQLFVEGFTVEKMQFPRGLNRPLQHDYSKEQIQSFLTQIDKAYRLSSHYQEKSESQSTPTLAAT